MMVQAIKDDLINDMFHGNRKAKSSFRFFKKVFCYEQPRVDAKKVLFFKTGEGGRGKDRK